MTPRLEQHIRQELFYKRVLTIPSIGSFHLKRESAKFSEDKSTIYPPNFHLHFTSDNYSNPLHPEYEDELYDLSIRIKNELKENGKSKIRGLGVFQKDNDKINFYPEKELENVFTLGLEAVYGIKEVSKGYKGNQVAVETKTLVTEKPKKDFSQLTKYAKILGALLAVFGLVYALLNIPINIGNNTPQIKPIKVTTPEEVKHRMDSTRVADSIADAAIQNQRLLDSIAQFKADSLARQSADSIAKVNAKLENEKLAQEITKKRLEVAKLKKANALAAQNRTANKKEKTTPKSTVSTNKVPKTKNELSPITGKPCAIIVGSFKSSTYTLKMIKKLQRNNYKVYSEENDSMTRVGLLYSCKNTNGEELLEKIKKEYNANAWILQ